MSEGDWLRSDDPGAMLSSLGSAVDERKLRLFAAACWRRVDKSARDDKVRAAVEASERYADGQITREELVLLTDRLGSTCPFASMPCADAARLASETAVKWASIAAWQPIIDSDPRGEQPDTFERAAAIAHAARATESRLQAVILRDIFGNPFQPAAMKSEWLTRELLEAARRIYDERALSRVSELALALERAGCNDRTVLAHCRGQSIHVLGCWLLDAILGKGSRSLGGHTEFLGRKQGRS